MASGEVERLEAGEAPKTCKDLGVSRGAEAYILARGDSEEMEHRGVWKTLEWAELRRCQKESQNEKKGNHFSHHVQQWCK